MSNTPGLDGSWAQNSAELRKFKRAGERFFTLKIHGTPPRVARRWRWLAGRHPQRHIDLQAPPPAMAGRLNQFIKVEGASYGSTR